MTTDSTTPNTTPHAPVRLGLRANLAQFAQFALLVAARMYETHPKERR
ncbi:hypothetical protein [Streptosporangium sp. NPDC087985]